MCVHAAPRSPVPVFPLPELVLFPRATVPLHIFELRYRTMVRDALSRERLIALALLKPGYEADYHGSPEFHPLGCLARFEEVEWLPDDRYNLIVMGVARVRLDRIVSEFPYRSACVELLPQQPYPEDDPLVRIEQRALLELHQRMRVLAEATAGPEAARFFPPFNEEQPYELIVNAACMLCGAPAQERLQMLAQDSVIERGRRVRAIIEQRLRNRHAPRAGGEGEGGEHN
jgi:hypothetical protein